MRDRTFCIQINSTCWWTFSFCWKFLGYSTHQTFISVTIKRIKILFQSEQIECFHSRDLVFLATLLSAMLVSQERKRELVTYCIYSCIYRFKLWKINLIWVSLTMVLCIIVGCGNKSGKSSQKKDSAVKTLYRTVSLMLFLEGTKQLIVALLTSW